MKEAKTSVIKICYISCATIRGRADSRLGRGGGEVNLINRGGNEKKAIDSASSLRCLGFGRQEWQGRHCKWMEAWVADIISVSHIGLSYHIK